MAEEALGNENYYRDPTPLGDTKNINDLTEAIRSKEKGKDVREALARGLEVTFDTATKNGNANMEVAKARGPHTNLSERLDDIMNQLSSLASGGPSGVFSTLTALQSAYPSGNSNIYIVSDTGHWYYYNAGWKDGGPYQAPQIADASIDFRNISDDLKSGFYYLEKSIGKDISSVASAAGGAGASSFFVNANALSLYNGYLSKISIFAKATGTLKIVLGTLTGNRFLPRTSFDVTLAKTGLNVLESSKDFNRIEIYDGESLGIYTKSAGALGYSQGAGDYYYLGNVQENFGELALQRSTSNVVFYNYAIDAVANPEELIKNTSLNSKDTTVYKGQILLDSIDKFNSIGNSWQSNGWTLNAVAESNITNATLSTTEVYGLDQRIMYWECQLSDNTVIDIGTIPDKQRIPTVGTMIRISTVDNKISYMSRWTDGNNLTEVASVSIPFSIANQKIGVEIEKDGRTAKIRLKELLGINTFEHERTNADLRNYEQGCLQGKPTVILRLGSAKLYKHRHVAIGSATPQIYLIGDSITEGRGVTDSLKYGRLLQNYFGRENVLVSGIGGACLDEAYKRAVSETKNIAPKNVIINLGTNSAAYNYMQIMIDYFEGKGSKVFVCTLPAVDSYTTNILSLPNDIIALHVAMKDGGSTNNPDYYPSDDLLHPNAIGNEVMYKRVLRDALVKLR
ncbi:TPA: SGNH/GDSL hydrolase family protein [Streptococcus suis]